MSEYGTTVVRAHHLGKCYQSYAHPSHRLLQSIVPRLNAWLGRRARNYYHEHWALRDVSISIERGQCVGIIGRNGAGKSTFLQMLCGVLAPTVGHVEVSGRIAAMLELGAGFNPEFTGRQNVFFYAALLGLSRSQVQDKFDEIVAFADIGDYLDMPVNTYSTGMFMRLAFSVAYCVEPDILVVDEALAVGDARFQAKCYRKIDELIGHGATVLLVTHSSEQVVRHCDRAIWIEDGGIRMDGDPKEVTNAYLVDLFGYSEESGRRQSGSAHAVTARLEEMGHVPTLPLRTRLSQGYESRPGYNKDEFRYGTGDALLVDYSLITNLDGSEGTILSSADRARLTSRVLFRRACEQAIFGIQLRTVDGILLFADNTRDMGGGAHYHKLGPNQTAEVTFEFTLPLSSGDYFLSLGVSEDVDGKNVPLDRRFDSIQIRVTNRRHLHGIVDIPLTVEFSIPPVSS